MDIRAKQQGVFLKGFVPEGAEIAVGAALYELDETLQTVTVAATTPVAPLEPAHVEAVVKAAPTAAVTGGAAIEVKVPIMGESITTGVLASWLKKAGAAVAADDVVASIETDKVTVEVRSPQPGIISKIFADEGAEVNVGEPLFLLQPGDAPAVMAVAPKESSSSVYKEATESKKAASVAQVQAATPTPAKAVTPAPVAAPSTTATGGTRSETRVKMSRMRLR
jgi:pyruvate/2-oxoglutarate dehydrogenase complex dihydrolipoamide acyltransferase (E2) component